eukprot:TRINITY_DN2870_c0_g2_i2.p2 TRINITY_DN2870_c0_g2~~TRINITY_DN2870_c0_g2_i2.p2  ORF type:complete len:180 (-),score=49.45 TRINITY_DN2870_c0_g2_i2:219-758(-)
MEIESTTPSTTISTSSSSSSGKTETIIPDSVLDRYYTRFYCQNPDGEWQFVNQHTNGLAVVGLSQQHTLVQKQNEGDEEYNIVNVNFDVSNPDGKNFKVSGKKKQGGPKCVADGLMCELTCKNGKVFKVYCCVEGSLLEFNFQFGDEEQTQKGFRTLLKQSESNGYIGIIKPKQKKVLR